MAFDNYKYERPQLEEMSKDFQSMLSAFKSASDLNTALESFEKISTLRNEFSTMYNLAHIRHTINTKDNFYEEEQNYFDKNGPMFQELVTQFYHALLASPYKSELKKKWGDQLFVLAELSLKIFEPSILEDLQEENKLRSEYVKIKASAEIEYKGDKYNLSALVPLNTHKERAIRKETNKLKWDFYASKAAEVEVIFDKLVKVRTRIAKKLGYENFVQLGYNRMMRSDYNSKDVAFYREQILKHVVPLASKLYKRQAERIGIEDMKFYDESFSFASGNPKPQGKPEWIIAQAKQMYQELSAETSEFFNFMLDNNLMDLVNKEGKATGGYCTFIDNYKSPFIFSNFNGTSGDIDVLTHEAGHAFQVFSSRNIGLSEYNWPTYEAAEIHSMSMEFFTWPWMQLFFKGDTDKYKFSHLASAIKFLPYGVAVDEFQHYVYENPEATIADRNSRWKIIEKKYLPHRDYDGNEFLEAGGFWQRQNHIFASPFYYIDYTLAQVCAFQFWKKDREDHETAWSDYVRLCKEGGSRPFLELVKLANLQSPFDEACVKSVVEPIEAWLDSIDDSSF